MNYHVLYIIFGIIFLIGIFAFWYISGALKDPKQIYILTETSAQEKNISQ